VMLGVRRQTVNVVAGTLQEAGFTRYSHGVVTVVDRNKLEAALCECGFVRPTVTNRTEFTSFGLLHWRREDARGSCRARTALG
jgi:hypothetical protein